MGVSKRRREEFLRVLDSRRESWYAYFAETSAHGLSEIRSEQGWLVKGFWGVCWALCMWAFVVMMSRVVGKWESGWLGSRLEPVRREGVDWPELRVCWREPLYWAPSFERLNISKRVLGLLFCYGNYHGGAVGEWFNGCPMSNVTHLSSSRVLPTSVLICAGQWSGS